ncbi:hypothetical protein ACH492_20610 [Streptomyces sp. NPDC019443]
MSGTDPAAASAPPGAANLPGSASGVFVGRAGELERLQELLATRVRPL